MVFDLIILGAGPVGLYSASMAGYMKLKTLCLELDYEVGGRPKKLYPDKPIYDFPAYLSITGNQLVNNFLEQIKQYPDWVEIKTSVKIIKIINENNEFKLIDQNGVVYRTKFILLTIGLGKSVPKTIDASLLKNEKHKVHYHLNKKDFYEDKDVVVLGGGDGAIDHSRLIMEKFNPKSVTMIHRRNELSTNLQQLDLHQKLGVKILLNHKILEIYEDKIIILDNETHEKKKINTDVVLVQYGTLNNDIHDLINLEKINNKYVVDSDYQTNVANVFAAGTCIHKPDRIDMIITGISEATIALNKIKSFFKEKRVIW